MVISNDLDGSKDDFQDKEESDNEASEEHIPPS